MRKKNDGSDQFSVQVLDLGKVSPLSIQSEVRTNRDNIYIVAHGGLMVNGASYNYTEYVWNFSWGDSVYEGFLPKIGGSLVPLSFYGDLNPENLFGCFISRRVRKFHEGVLVKSSIDQYTLMYTALGDRLKRYLQMPPASCSVNIKIYEGERYRGGYSTEYVQEHWPVKDEQEYVK